MQLIVEEAHLSQREGRYGTFLSLDIVSEGNRYTVMKGNIDHFKDVDKEKVCKGSILTGETSTNGKYQQFLVDSIVNPEHKTNGKSIQSKLVKLRNQTLEILNTIEAML